MSLLICLDLLDRLKYYVEFVGVWFNGIMGNLPLNTHKKDGLHFGSYSPSTSSGHLRLRGYPSFDRSLEDLHPFPPRRERWVRSEEKDFEDSTILGMEVDQESVRGILQISKMKIWGEEWKGEVADS